MTFDFDYQQALDRNLRSLDTLGQGLVMVAQRRANREEALTDEQRRRQQQLSDRDQNRTWALSDHARDRGEQVSDRQESRTWALSDYSRNRKDALEDKSSEQEFTLAKDELDHQQQRARNAEASARQLDYLRTQNDLIEGRISREKDVERKQKLEDRRRNNLAYMALLDERRDLESKLDSATSVPIEVKNRNARDAASSALSSLSDSNRQKVLDKYFPLDGRSDTSGNFEKLVSDSLTHGFFGGHKVSMDAALEAKSKMDELNSAYIASKGLKLQNYGGRLKEVQEGLNRLAPQADLGELYQDGTLPTGSATATPAADSTPAAGPGGGIQQFLNEVKGMKTGGASVQPRQAPSPAAVANPKPESNWWKINDVRYNPPPTAKPGAAPQGYDLMNAPADLRNAAFRAGDAIHRVTDPIRDRLHGTAPMPTQAGQTPATPVNPFGVSQDQVNAITNFFNGAPPSRDEQFKAKQMALSDGVTEDQVQDIVNRANSGDMQAIGIYRNYIQKVRATSGGGLGFQPNQDQNAP